MLAVRLTTEGMPMHVPAFGDVRREADGAFVVRLIRAAVSPRRGDRARLLPGRRS